MGITEGEEREEETETEEILEQRLEFIHINVRHQTTDRRSLNTKYNKCQTTT